MFWRYHFGLMYQLNASDERGIDVVRSQIKAFSGSGSLFHNSSSNLKLVILDEADSMTNAAQDALRRGLDLHLI